MRNKARFFITITTLLLHFSLFAQGDKRSSETRPFDYIKEGRWMSNGTIGFNVTGYRPKGVLGLNSNQTDIQFSIGTGKFVRDQILVLGTIRYGYTKTSSDVSSSMTSSFLGGISARYYFQSDNLFPFFGLGLNLEKGQREITLDDHIDVTGKYVSFNSGLAVLIAENLFVEGAVNLYHGEYIDDYGSYDLDYKKSQFIFSVGLTYSFGSAYL